ncbi:MAG: GvpL/GvpF family gas vesicle protein [Longimicrobiales bacterium]
MSEEDNPVLQDTAREKSTSPKALCLVGIQRARSWRGRRVAHDESGAGLRLRYRDLEALARPVAFQVPELDGDAVQEHQRAVEAAMRRGTILPAPFGLIFHGRRPLVRMLQDQYLVLDEALAFLDGQCEVRVHVLAADGNEPDEELRQAANQVYSDLRRLARAAVPFPRSGRRLLSSAFLVEKAAWVEFIQHAESLASAHAEITLDITGPWPPYDFVHFVT